MVLNDRRTYKLQQAKLKKMKLLLSKVNVMILMEDGYYNVGMMHSVIW